MDAEIMIINRPNDTLTDDEERAKGEQHETIA
jgi:hypothetical protein